MRNKKSVLMTLNHNFGCFSGVAGIAGNTITIPKGKRVNFKMLAKVYGSLQTYDYSNTAVAATCRVYLIWGIN
jgi:hypothetical protein